jgi:hypothetical protein
MIISQVNQGKKNNVGQSCTILDIFCLFCFTNTRLKTAEYFVSVESQRELMYMSSCFLK